MDGKVCLVRLSTATLAPLLSDEYPGPKGKPYHPNDLGQEQDGEDCYGYFQEEFYHYVTIVYLTWILQIHHRHSETEARRQLLSRGDGCGGAYGAAASWFRISTHGL